VQGTCAFGTGCRGARLLVWLILNDRVQPSLIAGVRKYLAYLTGRGVRVLSQHRVRKSRTISTQSVSRSCFGNIPEGLTFDIRLTMIASPDMETDQQCLKGLGFTVRLAVIAGPDRETSLFSYTGTTALA
jgi:hypothetical protein